MRVFQVGAAGGIGRRLAAILTTRGDQVTGMHRRPEQAEILRAAGADPLLADLAEIETSELADLMRGHDAVVFSAGAHGGGAAQEDLVDGGGLFVSLEAAQRAGITRFVLVSLFLDAERGRTTSETFEYHVATKRRADVRLVAADIDWLIVRPARLTEEPGTGTVRAAQAVDYGTISRDDVAHFIADSLHEPALRRVIIEMVAGDRPIGTVVAELAAG